jgi:hypothetical protein
MVPGKSWQDTIPMEKSCYLHNGRMFKIGLWPRPVWAKGKILSPKKTEPKGLEAWLKQ